MNDETMPPPIRKGPSWSYPIAVLLLGGGMASCFLQGQPTDQKVRVQEWRESRGPVVPHDTFPRDCTLCHAKGSWHEIRSDFAFDHAKETGVPLNGAHEKAQCLRCHNDRGPVGVFQKRGCTGCHEDIHKGRLGIKCTGCHTEGDWNPTGIYATHALTRFPLVGVHVGVSCYRCHPSADSGTFIGADPRCEACHRQDAVNAKALDHVAMGLLSNCQQCHTQTAWTAAHFNHAGITSGCVRCHLNDYNATTNPAHAASGIGTNCEACHNTSSWGSFNHSYFPLTHGGANSKCATCHPNMSNFASYTCVTASCHANQAQLASNHSGVNGYVYSPTSCYTCHSNGNAGKAAQILKVKQKK